MFLSVCFQLVFLLITHFVADFVCQTDKMALKKSKSFLWLFIHCAVYCGYTLYITWMMIEIEKALVYSSLLSMSHLVIDFVTSKLSSYYWKKEKRHSFFIIVGLDQLLHQITILFLFYYIFIS